jgi:large repetitive protein
VVLNGAGSYDPSGGYITSYQWQQIGGTPFVGLTGANTLTPTFTAPFVATGTTLTFRLIVTNSYGLTASSTVNISVTPNNINQPPIANAGPSQVVRPGALVVLNGAGSFDPSGGTIISYSWVQTAGPTVSLSGTNTATPTFIAPGAAIFLSFSLTVTNSGGLVSSPSTVFISVR